MNKNLFVVLLVFSVSSCQTPTPTLAPPTIPSTAIATRVPETPTSEVSQATLATAAPAQERLSPLTVDLSRPFVETLLTGEPLILESWTRQPPYAGQAIPLPINLSQVANAHLLDGLTVDQRDFLSKSGFVIIHSQEAQFGDIRVQTAMKTGQPYYLTTDAAFHALHLTFDELLKALERQVLRPQIVAITQATLDEVQSSIPAVKGTSLEAETQQAVAYLSVAFKLFDSEAKIDPSVADMVSRQVDQIMAAGGKAPSTLFPDFEDDYGAYKPVGHYAGDPELEAYFRGLTWFGRMHFRLTDSEKPAFVPSRLPLIVTLALRRARVGGAPASDAWALTHQTLNFLIGPSDDAGPLEYAALMDTIYGSNPRPQDLADDARWQEFLSRSDQLPAPQINSLFVTSTADLKPEKGWRFMGQRFNLDGFIFQNLIYDRVKERSDGIQREFPSGLDVMAAFGSAPAIKTLEDQGATTFPNYSDQMAKMRQAAQAQPEAQWLARFYDTWLYSFFPILETKNTSFPAYMQTAAWGYKDLNTALGSWAELKHDTILYTKMPEGLGGGGPPRSGPAPSYVEPNPEAFYRMAYMAQSLATGVQEKYALSAGASNADFSVDDYVQWMGDLGERLKTLGNIAAKELTGEPLTDDDNLAITECLGRIECMNQETDYNRPASEMPKPSIIAAVSGAQDRVLEVGIGSIDRLFVVVPLEGQQEIAQGGVFSYYEFTQPRDQRLTDDEWRAMLAGGSAPSLPAWASNFVWIGGQPTEWLAFRKGDIYIITEAGDKLNMRRSASIGGVVVIQLKTGEYIEIIDGPAVADGYTWWKIKSLNYSDEPTGWVVENPDWYERSYLP